MHEFVFIEYSLVSIVENIDFAEEINQKLKNRNIDKKSSLRNLQIEMLESHKNEKHIKSSDLEVLKKQL